MVFSSLVFLYAFLPLTLVLVWMTRRVERQNVILLILSLFFYAWGEPLNVVLMLITATVAWLCTMGMEKQPERRKFWLVFACVALLGALVVFKYLGFFVEQLNRLPLPDIPVPHIRLPIGISFYTFQVLTYVIDVYREEVPFQKCWYYFMLYVCLFPQLIAGPIVRYGDVAEQIENRAIEVDRVSAGILRFCAGLAKKVLLANACGAVVDLTWGGELTALSTAGAWLGLLMYTMQIYFDFSAYSDMAIGLGYMIGFDFKENFDYPYVAGSITDFWRRWHISLSTFFRDYVYIPLGGNRRHQYRNMLIVWGLTGLWHGASWNYVLWGLYWFVFLALEKRFLQRVMEHWSRFFQHLYTLVFVLAGWVLFYFTDLSAVAAVFQKLAGAGGLLMTAADKERWLSNLLLLLVGVIACLPVVPRLKEWTDRTLRTRALSAGSEAAALRIDSAWTAVRVALMLFLLFASTLRLAGSSYNPFLYFQF